MKKLMAVALSAVMALSVFVAPQTELSAKALTNDNQAKVYTMNTTTDLTLVQIQTPPMTTKLYAGLSWERLELGMGVRLNVGEAQCGPEAFKAFTNQAKAMGTQIVKVVDMDLEAYLDGSGYTYDLVECTSPIRVCLGLPKNTVTAGKSFAVLSIKADGQMEVLADLDPHPNTITVDSSYFDTFAIISGPAGSFNQYAKASADALKDVKISNYAKYVGSTINANASCYMVYSIGMVSDAKRVEQASGYGSWIEIKDAKPGPEALSALQYASKYVGAKKTSYYEVDLYNGYNQRVEKTKLPLLVTVTVPFNFPAYADYAIAVINDDGSVTVHRDIDANDSTVSVVTDNFRTFGIMWAPKGGALAK